jgi:hypothetical protein
MINTEQVQEDVPVTQITRLCSKCRQRKTTEYFYKSKHNPSGWNTYCKECIKERAKEKKAKSVPSNPTT